MIDLLKEADYPKLAVLCAVHLPEYTDREFRDSVEELGQLAKTLGLKVIGEITQKRPGFDSAAYIGSGKIADLKAMISHEPENILILVDHEISPSQARNLENETGAAGVLDRTAVILEIFHHHAHSRQAKLQVEMVRLTYLAPRMRESSNREDRQRGVIGGKGTGESKVELDRRKIRDRISDLRRELASLATEKKTQRSRRQSLRRVAICGYTNAGKSTLFHALTHSEVYIADKLFATLDTTVRVLQPEVYPKILVSDTIGFIRNLPTKLVESFKTTLDEALEAGLLVHVVDCSDPAWQSHVETTNGVLAEIGAEKIPQILIFNKADKTAERWVASEHPEGLTISAYNDTDVEVVRSKIIEFFEKFLVDAEIIVPYARQDLRGEIFSYSRVLEEENLEEGVRFKLRTDIGTLNWLKHDLK